MTNEYLTRSFKSIDMGAQIDWDEQLHLAKTIDLARPLGLTEQRLVEELRHERLVESCEGTLICQVAERMGGDNYTK